MTKRSSVEIYTEWDVVAARQLGREVAKEIGFRTVDQARITTAISELARNIYLYAGAGEIEIVQLEEGSQRGISIIATEHGPEIPHLRRLQEDGITT